MNKGSVILLGAGPGDPGLLTIKAKAFIQEADVLVYDNLISKSILSHAREDAEFIYVGKKGSCHTISQEEINAILIAKAKDGCLVARVKGGDPFIFGRGAEEAEALVKEGIPFEVVPGVTSAISAPAYAGIPLSHRDFTSTISFITGRESHGKKESNLYWEKIANGIGTLVILMGIKSLPEIARNLIENGRSPDTPVAVIHWGTTPFQKTITGRLDNVSELARQEEIKPPGIIIVGDIVNLRSKLNWFEKKPLLNKKILVTRAADQAMPLIELIEMKGGVPIPFPTIETVSPDSWDSLDRCINNISSYDWIIFTSVNGVNYFIERLKVLGRDIRELKGIKVCAIGEKTAKAITSLCINVDIMPEKFVAEAVLDSLQNLPIKGKRFFIPRALKARDVIPDELRLHGAIVDIGVAYKTVVPEENDDNVIAMINRGELDVITFTSSSTVKNFFQIIEKEKVNLFNKIVVTTIGPVTSKTVEQFGLKSDIVAESSTVESLIQGLENYFKEERDGKEKYV